MSKRLAVLGVASAAALLSVVLLASAAAVPAAGAAPGAGVRAAASPAPSGCPDLTDGTLSLQAVIAAGAPKMAACLAAAELATVTFDAYFTPQTCAGCGGSRDAYIAPGWLSGGLVDVSATTGAITPAAGISRYGMRVATGPAPAFADDAAAAAWAATHAIDLRLPPGVGTCVTDDTTSAGGCSVARYAGQVLRITVRYGDPAAETCEGRVVDGAPIPQAAAIAYCREQPVVLGFVVTQPYVCPAGPYTVLELSHFTTERLVACLGDRTITVTGFVPTPVVSATEPRWAGGPTWLVDDGAAGVVLASGVITEEAALAWMKVRVPPKLGACETVATAPSSCPFRPFVGRWVRFVGHFADPVAAKCTARWVAPGAAPAWFSADAVRQYCREQFVLTARPKAIAAPKAR